MLCLFKECQRPAGEAGMKFVVHKSQIIEDHDKNKNFLLRNWKSLEILSRAVTVTDFLLRRTAVVAVLRIFYIGQGLKLGDQSGGRLSSPQKKWWWPGQRCLGSKW